MSISKTVTILLTNQVSMFELSCALELFALPRREFDSWYTARVVSLTSDSFPSLCNTVFKCEQVSQLPHSDLLIIPSYSVQFSDSHQVIVEQVRKHSMGGGKTISFCSGAFLLAESGLLDGRVATTHWMYADLFQKRFPHIQFKPDIIYQYDGVVGCSAGSAAGIDLGIEVIRQDFGHKAANTVARRLVLPAHRSGGQSQYVEKPVSLRPSSISKALEWAVQNLSSDLSIEDIASKASMSRRSFDRNFKKNYKMTPGEWLTERKLETAKKLLETTELSIEQVAVRSGYDSPITLRQNFKKTLSTSPTNYRMSFGEKHSKYIPVKTAEVPSLFVVAD
ncbi:GlxA family transcriptional regulator [Alteromonas sp. CYL-A6]|uniref:GlxA family transcriptional regulator n=1 Tax=Alteromonas nitratireducens TaxID=3390813 RepID=UPI0034B68452